MKCRISYDPDLQLWEFYSPKGVRAFRSTFAEAVEAMDAHLGFLKRNGIER